MINLLRGFKFQNMLFVVMAFVVSSCFIQETDAPTGTLTISFNNVSPSSGRVANDANPAFILFSASDSDGNLIFNNQKIEIYSLGDGYLSENIQMEIGSYQLEEFSVLDDENNVIYLTPKEGSELAAFVNDPLPISFDITFSNETTISPEVLSSSFGDALDFGYAVFTFNILDPLTNNLIAFFDFKGDANDRIGTISGTVNGAALTDDRSLVANAAYFFDGLDDNIDMGDVLDVGSDDFSIVVHAKVGEFFGLKSGTNTRGAQIISKGNTIFGTPARAGYSLFAQEEDNGDNVFRFVIGSESEGYFTLKSSGVQTNRWYTIACVKSDNEMKLYVDSELEASMTIPQGMDLDNNIPFVVGSINKLGNDAAGTTFYSGDIDDIRIYNKALSARLVELLR
ncbi:MAG: LamG domain-containing protein [Cytophagales bacterium]|nr:LamG domain-containing protein [Cytophagales bacterium]